MKHFPESLKEVDRVEVLTLIDNYVDLLLKNTDIVTRPSGTKDGEILTNTLVAEHGLSLLITAHRGERTDTILFDTGYGQIGVLHNMEFLGIVPESIGTIVLSHAHMDHTGSLYPLLEKVSKPVSLVVHPDAFQFPRYVEGDDGERRRFPRTLVRDDLIRKRVEILESEIPLLIADGMVLVSGEVERTTPFEKGMPNALMEKNGHLDRDPIADDQALILNVADKGLVVISGCSHSGIINTIRYARKITGVNNVHAVMGGFHLTGTFFERIIEETIREMKDIKPEFIVPMHCTGWKAIHRFSKAFPSSFVLNSVGTKITLPGLFSPTS